MGICKQQTNQTWKQDCGICLQRMQKTYNQIKPCGHYFCELCIDNWHKVKKTCPLCRAKIEDLLRFNNNQLDQVSKIKRVKLVTRKYSMQEKQILINKLDQIKSSKQLIQEKIRVTQMQVDGLDILVSRNHFFEFNGQSYMIKQTEINENISYKFYLLNTKYQIQHEVHQMSRGNEYFIKIYANIFQCQKYKDEEILQYYQKKCRELQKLKEDKDNLKFKKHQIQYDLVQINQIEQYNN